MIKSLPETQIQRLVFYIDFTSLFVSQDVVEANDLRIATTSKLVLGNYHCSSQLDTFSLRPL